jgi:hypothetical protein
MSVQFERDSEPGKSFPSDLIGANRLTWSEVKQLLLPFDWRNDQTEVSRDQREPLRDGFRLTGTRTQCKLKPSAV